MKTQSKAALAALLNSKATLRDRLKAGFTLIEILIVVAIIGIILGIAVPALQDAREDALQTKQDALVAQLATAKTRYYLKNPSVSEATDLTFNDIQEYLSVNGVASPSQVDFLSGFSNLSVGNGNTDPTVTR